MRAGNQTAEECGAGGPALPDALSPDASPLCHRSRWSYPALPGQAFARGLDKPVPGAARRLIHYGGNEPDTTNSVQMGLYPDFCGSRRHLRYRSVVRSADGTRG